MTVIPTGSLTLPLENLRKLLAATPEFQAWVGAADAAAATAHIHIHAIPGSSLSRPLALIAYGDVWVSQKNATGSFGERGEANLLFEDNIAEEITENDEDATYTFLNDVGGCVVGLQRLQGIDTNLVISKIEFAVPPSRSKDDKDPEDDEDYYRAPLVVSWGIY